LHAKKGINLSRSSIIAQAVTYGSVSQSNR
jgi:hypothetical protein